jgi:cytochrome P450
MARQQVLKIRSGTDIDAKSHHSIFHTLLDSDLSATDKETDRLSKEGFVIVAAGGDTTGATISLILFHLIANPAKLTRLRSELAPLFSKTSPPVTWIQLERLPYMSSVVNECLRMDYGVTSRLPRCAPERDTLYKDVAIPLGTPVSMSIFDIHDDPTIFFEPKVFIPERWIRDEKAGPRPDPVIPTKKGT